ncbi:hypothetical protein HHI36_001765 [Cryptolaemus montrouzieri]|uniref:Uncharacterized protein n=1 Tax=Cryptolaemus montrouzieri TaxID=559131 RepID=A0ABD2P8W6_9CUCU
MGDDTKEEDNIAVEDLNDGIMQPEDNGVVQAEEDDHEGHSETHDRDIDQLSNNPSVGDDVYPAEDFKRRKKIVMLSDSSTEYMVDAYPCLGRNTSRNGIPLSNYYV